MDEDVAVLKRARALVEAGWVQKHWQSYDSKSGGVSYCLAGAILVAAGGYVDGAAQQDCGAVRAFNKAVWGVDTCSSGHIVMYNDAGGRTKEEVLALLDQVIVNLEAGVFMKRLFYVDPPTLYDFVEIAPGVASGFGSWPSTTVVLCKGTIKFQPAPVLHVKQELTAEYSG